MTQLFNPIQGKLSKMRSSQMIRCITHPDTVPSKPDSFLENEKQNITLCPFTQHSQESKWSKNGESSMKKLGLLERRSIQKQESINFYRNQLKRRKQKYVEQLSQQQQKYQKQLNVLEEQLIEKMKQQQQLDEEAFILASILDQIQENGSTFYGLNKLSDSLLELFQQKLQKIGVMGCQLLYSKQTAVVQHKCEEKTHLGRVVPASVSTNRKYRLTTRSEIYENEKWG